MLRLAIAILALVGAAPVALAQFSPRAVVSWETRDSNGTTTTQLRQEVELFLDRAITDVLRLRIGLTGTRLDTSATSLNDAVVRRVGVQMQPAGSLTYTNGGFRSDSEYRVRRRSDSVGSSSYTNSYEDLRSKVEVAQRRWLPSLRLDASRMSMVDGRRDDELVNDSLQLATSYAAGPIQASVSQSMRRTHDSRLRYGRADTTRGASVSFSDSYWANRISLSADARASESEIDDSTPGRPAAIPRYHTVRRAFWGVDDTPLDTTDRPLSALPGLSDGRFSDSAGVSLGPDAQSFQNIALDFGRIAPIDQLEISMRDERSEPVAAENGIRWDVYVSNDGQRWTPHSTGLRVEYDETRSQYEISFDRIEAVWIKAVNFGVLGTRAFVTEARAIYFDRILVSGDSRNDDLAANIALTVRPHRTLSFSYDTSSYESQQQIQADVYEQRDRYHTLGAFYAPLRAVSVSLRREQREGTLGDAEQTFNGTTATLQLTPRQQLQFGVTCDLVDETLRGQVIERSGCGVNMVARVLPTVDVTGSAHRSGHLDVASGTEARSLNVAASVTARVSRRLRIALSGTSSRSEQDGTATIPYVIVRDERVFAQVDWSAGSAFRIGTTVGWAAGAQSEGLVQTYRVGWTPFSGGSVSFQTHYSRDIDPNTDSVSERLGISPRWRINPRTTLLLTYSNVTTTGTMNFTTESVLATLVLAR